MINKKILLIAALIFLLPFSSCSKTGVDEDGAEKLVAELPEVKAFIRAMDASGDDVTAIILMDEEGEGPGPDYMMFTVAESHPSHVVTWQRFFVNRKDSGIVVADVIEGEFISLDEWRRRYAADIKAIEDMSGDKR
jgi:hypothetical protein